MRTHYTSNTNFKGSEYWLNSWRPSGEEGVRRLSSGLQGYFWRGGRRERWLYLEKGGGGWRWREEYALGWGRRGCVLDGGGSRLIRHRGGRDPDSLLMLMNTHTFTHTHTHTQQSGRLTEDRRTKAKSNLLENNKESWKRDVREKLKGTRREEEQEPEGRKR